MSFKDILVHVDNSKHCPDRLDAAINLATAHGAHLTGLYILPRPEVPEFIQAQLGPDIIEMQNKVVREMAAQAEKAFRDVVGRSGVPHEWRAADGPLEESMIVHTHYADIVVVGQHDPEGDEVPGAASLPDRMVLTAGRPVLVIPYVGNFPTIGRHVLVAWNASRQSTRAVNDALPILKQAKKVSVLAINPEHGANGHGQIPSADICLHLARHGVKVEAQHVFADDVDAGNMLLSRAADEGADLIVMGAYGHRRLRELVLGGVTRHLLKHMTAPVLMSH
jgi:nucleotide-binding universal stress UspA family protein